MKAYSFAIWHCLNLEITIFCDLDEVGLSLIKNFETYLITTAHIIMICD